MRRVGPPCRGWDCRRVGNRGESLPTLEMWVDSQDDAMAYPGGRGNEGGSINRVDILCCVINDVYHSDIITICVTGA